jgi:hypothetical protein
VLLELPKFKDYRMRYASSTHKVDARRLLETAPGWLVEHLRRKGVLKGEPGEAWLDYYTLEPGQRLEVFRADEPGVIASLWMTINAHDRRFLRNVVIRAYWDGESEPSVESPIGDFFLQGHRAFAPRPSLAASAFSLPLGLSSGGFYCFLPMPFERARIEVENLGAEEVPNLYYIIGYYTGVDVSGMGRFHAVWRREKRVKPGEPYTILRARGRGHYVGVYLYVRGLSLKSPIAGGLGFLEGNTRIEADGEVVYQATGTEDYFLSGWYFAGGPFAAPFHGLLHKSEEGGEIAAYRFHIPDPVPFREWIAVTTPHGEWNDVEADYSSVAYWYQSEPHTSFYRLREDDLY